MCTHVYILCFSLSCSLLLIYHYSVIIGSKYVIVLCATVLYNVQVYRFCEFQSGH